MKKIITVVFLCSFLLANSSIKIFISVDMEGILMLAEKYQLKVLVVLLFPTFSCSSCIILS